MKKIYQILWAVVFLTGMTSTGFAQCLNTSSWGGGTVGGVGTTNSIASCAFAGEYSPISGAVSGQNLRVASSVAGDFITIRSGSFNGPVVASGVTPLTFSNNFTGTIYAHWNTSSACGSSSTCRNGTVENLPAGPAGCLNTVQFGSATINTSGIPVTITTCAYAGEFSPISGAVAGQTLTFTSSVSTDYLTVRSGSSSGPIVAQGTTPLTFANTFTGTLYVHYNTSSACGSQSSCRTTTVTGTPAGPAGCLNTAQFGSATINTSGALVTITTCAYAGEFSPISGAVAGQTLTFTSSVSTDYLTVRSGSSSGPVVAQGTTPLTFANTFTGTLYVHYNTSSACGSQSSCRTTTVQCTSCGGGGGSYVVPSSGSNTITACSGTVTDHAGGGNYSNFASGTLVINPSTPGAAINLAGTYDTESSFDFVRIYAGAGTGGALLFSGSGIGNINVTGPAGQPVTVQFTSDGSITYSGFSLNISCTGAPTAFVVPSSGSNTVTACSGTVTDHAGAGNYSNSVNGTLVINPATAGASVNLSGTYDTELGYDFVRVYAGVGTGGAVLFSGSGSGSINVTGAPGQAVTVQFTSDFIITAPGFSLNISCVAPPAQCFDASLTAPASTTGNTCGAGDDSGLRPGEDVIYKVTIPASGCYTFSMCGTSPNWDSYMYLTTLCPGTGGTAGGGTIVAFNDDGCGGIGVSQISNVNLTAGTYYLTIEPWGSGCGAFNLNITGGTAPVVGAISNPGAFGCNSTVGFSVPSTTGVTYTWSTSNGTITSGQGTSSINVAWGSGGGTVSVTPSNVCGNGTPSSITVACTPGPANDDCNNATPFIGNSQPFSTIFATGTDISSCTFGDFNDVWFTWTAPSCGQVTFNTCGSGFDTHLSLWTSCGAGEIACNDDFCGLQSSVSANVVAGQTYYLRAAGYNGAQGTGTINMSMTAPLVGSLIAQTYVGGFNVSCNGATDGSVFANISGGTAPYSYSWSNGGSGQMLSGVGAGAYTLTATDANGCTYVESITLTEPAAVVATTVSSSYACGFNVSCNGASDGSINLSVTGGTGVFAYAWSNGATTEDVSGLAAGTYSVTATDQNGCSTSATVTLTEPAALTASLTLSNYNCGFGVSCFGANDGSISAAVSGGCAPYSYSWSTSGAGSSIGGLAAAAYSVTISDANGCQVVANAELTSPAAVVGSGVAATFACGYNVSCNGAADGSIDYTVTGGCAPYSYLWSNGATTEDASGLAAGSYSVTATDANGCSVSNSFTLTEPAALTFTCPTAATVYYGWAPSACATLNVSNIAGGCGPYSISWSNGATTSSITVCPTVTTDYTVTVTDANGCASSCNVRVCVIDVRCGNNLQKIEICHVPPGNSNNSSTLCVSPNAVQNHLNNGSYLGACGSNVPCVSSNKNEAPSAQSALDETNAGITMEAFPNPFEKNTTVRFSLPVNDKVTVSVYGLDGRKVATVFEGDAEAGMTYEVGFDATNISSGIYFARLTQASGQVATMKLVVKN